MTPASRRSPRGEDGRPAITGLADADDQIARDHHDSHVVTEAENRATRQAIGTFDRDTTKATRSARYARDARLPPSRPSLVGDPPPAWNTRQNYREHHMS